MVLGGLRAYHRYGGGAGTRDDTAEREVELMNSTAGYRHEEDSEQER